MKKLVFVLTALFCFFLIACNEKQVNEKLDGKSVDNKINLESKQDLDNNLEQEEIIYDEQLNVETSDIEETNQEQKVNDDEKKQGYETEMSNEKLIELAKQKYLETNMSNATIEDVRLFYFLGIYHGDLVGVFIDKKAFFLDELCSIQVADFIFDYSWGYDILVFHNGNFYDLQQAYNDKYISQNDLIEIYNIYNTHKIYE